MTKSTNPIVCESDDVLVSGHQRLIRNFKVLGLDPNTFTPFADYIATNDHDAFETCCAEVERVAE